MIMFYLLFQIEFFEKNTTHRIIIEKIQTVFAYLTNHKNEY